MELADSVDRALEHRFLPFALFLGWPFEVIVNAFVVTMLVL